MTALMAAVEGLIEQIQAVTRSEQRLFVHIELPENFNAVQWLESQPIFPKVFWQSRDGKEQVAALGLCTSADKLNESNLLEGQRFWGGTAFNHRTQADTTQHSYFFFLPQVELIQVDQQWQLAVNVTRETQSTLVDTLRRLAICAPVGTGFSHRIVSRTDSPSFPAWSEMLDKALTEIDQTELEKVVLARCSTYQLDVPMSAAQLLSVSRHQNEHSFHFMLAMDEEQQFIGSTPERLFIRNDDQLKTEALAGTIGRGENSLEDQRLAQWLLDDEKNHYENQLVVNDIVERLQSHTQYLQVPESPELVRLSKVQHLRKRISASLQDNISSLTLLDALQPTAAIAGLPRNAALEFIAKHEPFTRGWYSGAIGYIGKGCSEFCVALRSAMIQGSQVQVYAGAGIVPGSEAKSEWQELNRKSDTLVSLFETHHPEVERKSA